MYRCPRFHIIFRSILCVKIIISVGTENRRWQAIWWIRQVYIISHYRKKHLSRPLIAESFHGIISSHNEIGIVSAHITQTQYVGTLCNLRSKDSYIVKSCVNIVNTWFESKLVWEYWVCFETSMPMLYKYTPIISIITNITLYDITSLNIKLGVLLVLWVIFLWFIVNFVFLLVKNV